MNFSNAFELAGIWEFDFSEMGTVPQMLFKDVAPVPGCFDLMPEYYLKRGTGSYRRYVEIGGMVELYSEGLGLRGEIFWDGKKIAEVDAPFSKNIFRFDAGEFKKHELIISVNNEFDDSNSSLWRRNYDFYAHGGIYRRIAIRQAEKIFEREIKIITANIERGEVEITLDLDGEIGNISNAKIIFDNSVKEFSLELKQGKGKGIFAVPDFKLWSPESPSLHTAYIKVGDVVFEKTFGIRKVEAKNGKIYLNGKKLHLIGYNRHDAHPDFGYAVPSAVRCQDLQILKQQRANCIRGSHYPQSEEFLDLCDRMGVLVWEESLGWGNNEAALTDPDFQAKQIRETRKMALASINHPCIILRGFLNEASTSLESAKPLVKKLADTLHEVDPTCLVTYGSNVGNRDVCAEFVDVISCNTYPCWYSGNEDQFVNYDEVKKVLGELEEFASDDKLKNKPLIISEVGAEAFPNLHGGQRWSEEYQADLLEAIVRHVTENERYSGTFLWQFCDTRTYISNGSQIRAGNFNFKGALDRHRVPKESWRRIAQVLKEYEF